MRLITQRVGFFEKISIALAFENNTDEAIVKFIDNEKAKSRDFDDDSFFTKNTIEAILEDARAANAYRIFYHFAELYLTTFSDPAAKEYIKKKVDTVYKDIDGANHILLLQMARMADWDLLLKYVGVLDADPNVISPSTRYGYDHILSYAAANANLDIFQKIEKLVDKNRLQNPKFVPPFMAAVEKGNYSVIEYLLQQGADLTAPQITSWYDPRQSFLPHIFEHMVASNGYLSKKAGVIREIMRVYLRVQKFFLLFDRIPNTKDTGLEHYRQYSRDKMSALKLSPENIDKILDKKNIDDVLENYHSILANVGLYAAAFQIPMTELNTILEEANSTYKKFGNDVDVNLKLHIQDCLPHMQQWHFKDESFRIETRKTLDYLKKLNPDLNLEKMWTQLKDANDLPYENRNIFYTIEAKNYGGLSQSDLRWISANLAKLKDTGEQLVAGIENSLRSVQSKLAENFRKHEFNGKRLRKLKAAIAGAKITNPEDKRTETNRCLKRIDFLNELFSSTTPPKVEDLLKAKKYLEFLDKHLPELCEIIENQHAVYNDVPVINALINDINKILPPTLRVDDSTLMQFNTVKKLIELDKSSSTSKDKAQLSPINNSLDKIRYYQSKETTNLNDNVAFLKDGLQQFKQDLIEVLALSKETGSEFIGSDVRAEKQRLRTLRAQINNEKLANIKTTIREHLAAIEKLKAEVPENLVTEFKLADFEKRFMDAQNILRNPDANFAELDLCEGDLALYLQRLQNAKQIADARAAAAQVQIVEPVAAAQAQIVAPVAAAQVQIVAPFAAAPVVVTAPTINESAIITSDSDDKLKKLREECDALSQQLSSLMQQREPDQWTEKFSAISEFAKANNTDHEALAKVKEGFERLIQRVIAADAQKPVVIVPIVADPIVQATTPTIQPADESVQQTASQNQENSDLTISEASVEAAQPIESAIPTEEQITKDSPAVVAQQQFEPVIQNAAPVLHVAAKKEEPQAEAQQAPINKAQTSSVQQQINEEVAATVVHAKAPANVTKTKKHRKHSKRKNESEQTQVAPQKVAEVTKAEPVLTQQPQVNQDVAPKKPQIIAPTPQAKKQQTTKPRTKRRQAPTIVEPVVEIVEPVAEIAPNPSLQKAVAETQASEQNSPTSKAKTKSSKKAAKPLTTYEQLLENLRLAYINMLIQYQNSWIVIKNAISYHQDLYQVNGGFSDAENFWFGELKIHLNIHIDQIAFYLKSVSTLTNSDDYTIMIKKINERHRTLSKQLKSLEIAGYMNPENSKRPNLLRSKTGFFTTIRRAKLFADKIYEQLSWLAKIIFRFISPKAVDETKVKSDLGVHESLPKVLEQADNYLHQDHKKLKPLIEDTKKRARDLQDYEKAHPAAKKSLYEDTKLTMFNFQRHAPKQQATVQVQQPKINNEQVQQLNVLLGKIRNNHDLIAKNDKGVEDNVGDLSLKELEPAKEPFIKAINAVRTAVGDDQIDSLNDIVINKADNPCASILEKAIEKAETYLKLTKRTIEPSIRKRADFETAASAKQPKKPAYCVVTEATTRSSSQKTFLNPDGVTTPQNNSM